jgi:hypothetical protein
MSDSRERFEAWRDAQHKYLEPADFWPWIEEAWMQAEAQAVRRCVELADRVSVHQRNVYKNRVPTEKARSYNPHTDGMSDGAIEVEFAIRAEFPEAFK